MYSVKSKHHALIVIGRNIFKMWFLYSFKGNAKKIYISFQNAWATKNQSVELLEQNLRSPAILEIRKVEIQVHPDICTRNQKNAQIIRFSELFLKKHRNIILITDSSSNSRQLYLKNICYFSVMI